MWQERWTVIRRLRTAREEWRFDGIEKACVRAVSPALGGHGSVLKGSIAGMVSVVK